MADVQIEQGYTKLANKILERLAKVKLSPTQFRLILIIWRYTYGFERKQHDMSLSFLAGATSCDKRQIQRELKELEAKSIIFQTIVSGTKRVISFNKDYDKWVGKIDIGKPTNGKSTNGEKCKSYIGETIECSIGETTNQERNILNKTLKKDICNSSAYKEIIQYFCDIHLEKTGIKYLFDGGKDGKIIQAMLMTYDPEFMKGLINWYFSTDDEFIYRVGYSIGKLKTSIDKYVAFQKKRGGINGKGYQDIGNTGFYKKHL